MVEPLASVVCNTFLSGRSKLHSVVRTVATASSRSGVDPHLFTPEPRRVKGKTKSEDVIPLDQSLREWANSSNRHLFWWPFHIHPMMLDELSSHDETGAPMRRKSKRPPKPRPRVARSLLTSLAFQRRHASHATDTPSTPDGHVPFAVSEISRHEEQIQHVQRIIQLDRSKVDLDDAWQTYQSSVEYDLPLRTKLSFLEKYLGAAELRYRSKDPRGLREELCALGDNALTMVEDLGSAIVPKSRFGQWRLCLLARASALRGDFDRAANIIREADAIPLADSFKVGIAYAYDMVLTSIVRTEGNVRAMEFMGDEWDNISHYINMKGFDSATDPLRHAADSLRRIASCIAAEIPQPLAFLGKKEWDLLRRRKIGHFFIQALSEKELGTEALDVVSRMEKLNLRVARPYLFALIRSLSRRTETLPSAVALYKSVEHTEEDLAYSRVGLHLYSRQGNVEAFERCFGSIKAMRKPGTEDIALLIHGYAVADDVKRAEETFEHYFPYGRNGRRSSSLDVSHYAAVIYAHAKKGGDNRKGISFWLADLAKADMIPNASVFTIVLNAFAAAGDLEATMDALGEMRKAGIKPNAVTYTIVITLLAHRKDPVGAEVIFKRALKEGVIPDNRMIVAVMNAHVEGGSWQGVIRAYDYLMAAGVTSLSLPVYNTLMKAYVLIGAPFNVVYKFFKRLEQTKTKPDAYTYSLLVQSACDAGLLDIAADIYYDMEELMQDNPDRNLHVNVYILTILMAGFLQQGDKVRAQAVYREMSTLGIDPSPITFRIILKAYANEQSEKSLQIAEDFIKTLVAVPEEQRTWKKPKYNSLSALHHLYSPVIRGWVLMKSPEDVERVFQDLQKTGEAPSIGNLSALMDVYRRTMNIDAVREIWPDIYKYGLKLTSKDWMTPEDGPSEITRGMRGNALCIPLSIYIDALSAAGEHHEIATVWKDLRNRGFSFDSHNWNHLSVAMVRAGQVERAFEVIERVIIPYQELSINSRKARDRHPTTPLLSDVVKEQKDEEEEEEEEEDEVPNAPAVRNMNRHRAAMISKSRTRDMEGFQNEDLDHSDDFAYHLHILHQISPTWATWKAHRATLTVLLMAFNSLHEGMLIRPIGQTRNHEDTDETTKARDMLNRIYEKNPKTVQLILEHDEKERLFLTPEEYRERYNWG